MTTILVCLVFATWFWFNCKKIPFTTWIWRLYIYFCDMPVLSLFALSNYSFGSFEKSIFSVTELVNIRSVIIYFSHLYYHFASNELLFYFSAIYRNINTFQKKRWILLERALKPTSSVMAIHSSCQQGIWIRVSERISDYIVK